MDTTAAATISPIAPIPSRLNRHLWVRMTDRGGWSPWLEGVIAGSVRVSIGVNVSSRASTETMPRSTH
jgi:hypothetical protein